MYKCTVLILALFMLGCDEEEELLRIEYVGNIISANARTDAGGFGNPTIRETAITCDKFSCTIRGLRAVTLGDSAFVKYYSDDTMWFTWESSGFRYLIK